ncbi:MAG: nuclear transport factor 2 family protein [Trebonia sp.]
MSTIDEFAARYVAVWNEPDEAAREAAVAGLWRADARACTAANDYVGLDAITGRVTAAYKQFVAGQGYVFRPLGAAETNHDGIRIRWEMVAAAGGDAVSGGAQFLVLDADQRVRFDYQFIDF